MTENLMPPDMLEMLKPEYVTPGVVYLASEDAPTGMILTAGAGVFCRGADRGDRRRQSRPWRRPPTRSRELGRRSPISSAAKHFTMGGEQTAKFFDRLQDKPVAANIG